MSRPCQISIGTNHGCLFMVGDVHDVPEQFVSCSYKLQVVFARPTFPQKPGFHDRELETSII